MPPPQSMPVGFTYDGEPLYAAGPVSAGARQPLAVLADGEPIWPLPDGSVAVGQPQPFGVLSSGAFVWAVEQVTVDLPAPWFRRKTALVSAAALSALLVTGVVAAASSSDDAPRAEQAQTTADRPAAEKQAPPAPTVLGDVMPDLLGSNLQVAQDQVQELGVPFPRSHDLLGTRTQVQDSNWKVCTQTPAPGTPLKGSSSDGGARIDFGVVKQGETCP